MWVAEGIFLFDGAEAVGAANSTLTPWAALSRQKEPGSGVPTGLPSYRMLVAPRRSGP